MEFISYGIHTRLYYNVKSAKGLDKIIRREWLKDTFGFDEETLDIVLMYNIEDSINTDTIENIKELILSNRYRKQCKTRNGFRRMMHNMSIVSNMLNNQF